MVNKEKSLEDIEAILRSKKGPYPDGADFLVGKERQKVEDKFMAMPLEELQVEVPRLEQMVQDEDKIRSTRGEGLLTNREFAYLVARKAMAWNVMSCKEAVKSDPELAKKHPKYLDEKDSTP